MEATPLITIEHTTFDKPNNKQVYFIYLYSN